MRVFCSAVHSPVALDSLMSVMTIQTAAEYTSFPLSTSLVQAPSLGSYTPSWVGFCEFFREISRTFRHSTNVWCLFGEILMIFFIQLPVSSKWTTHTRGIFLAWNTGMFFYHSGFPPLSKHPILIGHTRILGDVPFFVTEVSAMPQGVHQWHLWCLSKRVFAGGWMVLEASGLNFLMCSVYSVELVFHFLRSSAGIVIRA